MNRIARDVVRRILIVALLLWTDAALAGLEVTAELTLIYHQDTDKQMPNEPQLMARSEYLGSGDGVATGTLEGRIVWDLYEDQSLDDLHLTQFRGYIERQGKRHPFQIVGVFTPEAGQPIHRWRLTGTIVFDDAALFPARHAPVTGYIETGVWRHHYIVWGEKSG